MKQIRLLIALMLFSLCNLPLAHAVVFTIDANLNSVSPIFYDANSDPDPFYSPSPLDTGLFLNQDDLLEIDASGIWSNAPPSYNLIFGPDGNPNENILPGYPGTGFPVAALLGKVGNNSYFFIGSSYSSHVSEGGVLYLGFNDTDYGNNTGSIEANVKVTAVPEPSSVLLFALGLLGLFTRRVLN